MNTQAQIEYTFFRQRSAFDAPSINITNRGKVMRKISLRELYEEALLKKLESFPDASVPRWLVDTEYMKACQRK